MNDITPSPYEGMVLEAPPSAEPSTRPTPARSASAHADTAAEEKGPKKKHSGGGFFGLFGGKGKGKEKEGEEGFGGHSRSSSAPTKPQGLGSPDDQTDEASCVLQTIPLIQDRDMDTFVGETEEGTRDRAWAEYLKMLITKSKDNEKTIELKAAEAKRYEELAKKAAKEAEDAKKMVKVNDEAIKQHLSRKPASLGLDSLFRRRKE